LIGLVLATHIPAGRNFHVSRFRSDLSDCDRPVRWAACWRLGWRELRSAIIVDEKATDEQRAALVEFVKDHAGRAGKEVVRVDAAPISMSLDTSELRGNLQAGKLVKLTTRKAKATDCICSNEVAYYPPLAKIDRFAAGVSIEAEYKGKGLGTRWSTPNSRSAYMGEFLYE
jgi:hypothetical protein